MRYLFLSIGIAICYSTVYTQKIIVFSKIEVCYPDSIHNPCRPFEPEKREFLNDLHNEIYLNSEDFARARLIIPPLEWGRKVSDSSYGEIKYFNSFPHGFVCDVILANLLPNHRYLLTLNGNPKLVGNDLLPDTVPGMNTEKYYDFLAISTNAEGYYKAKIAIFLQTGDYHVRFYVKDTNDFKIILYHDYFKFRVNEEKHVVVH